MEIVSGKIVNITTDKLIIQAPYKNIERVCLRKYKDVCIGLPDGRRITPAQRKKAYVLLTKISEWSGYTPVEVIKETTKLQFMAETENITGKVFSLSDCDVTTAREYISFLIDFVIENNVPVGQPLIELCEDINKYVYACLMNKVCAVCGKPAQLHHVDRIGMGRNRNTINHLNMLVLPLCGKHHIECHGMSQYEFNEKYHLVSIKLTEEIGKKYNLSKKNLK
ncbi:putative HNHc nuclease [Pectinatus frisingensis]|uniref:putative HNHc nuclease n=1 Tax=Pectinatus frisingensis TaxID=865 RepID=UPI0018C6393A|nr:putative HNHc nuclease [Pectinatus frisingensis]